MGISAHVHLLFLSHGASVFIEQTSDNKTKSESFLQNWSHLLLMQHNEPNMSKVYLVKFGCSEISPAQVMTTKVFDVVYYLALQREDGGEEEVGEAVVPVAAPLCSDAYLHVPAEGINAQRR